jgi:hypothetical protein
MTDEDIVFSESHSRHRRAESYAVHAKKREY